MRKLVGGKSDDTLRKWINEGLFPQPQLNPSGHHVWKLGEVLDWIDKRERRAATREQRERAA